MSASLRISTAHIESTEWISTYHCASTLAIQIEVATVELFPSLRQLLLAVRVDSARKTIDRVVCNIQAVVTFLASFLIR